MLIEQYQAAVQRGEIQSDAGQLKALSLLQQVLDQLNQPAQRAWFGWGKPELIKGAYLFGNVGTGKTYLMDLFYDNLQEPRKLRKHFYQFMEMVHARLQTVEGYKNPLQLVAKEIAAQARVICFDEFFVVNIVDAMLLGNLLAALYEEGVTLVATSNVLPDDLYKDGLQRESFLPAIALLKANCQILEVDSGVDYRQDKADFDRAFFHPQDPAMREMLFSRFKQMAQSAVQYDVVLPIEDRPVQASYLGDKAVWFAFEKLCGIPRCQRDYLALSQQFETVFVSGLREIKPEQNDLINNFIKLVDVFYDAQTRLIMLSDVAMEKLYPEGRMSFAFQRTLSRLQEMQSEGYLGSSVG